MMKNRRYSAMHSSRRNRKSYVKSTRAETDNFTRYSHDSRSTTTVRETVSRNGTWSTDSSGSNGKVISLGNILGTRPLRQLSRFASLLIFLLADRPMRFGFFFHFFFFSMTAIFVRSRKYFSSMSGPLNPVLATARRISGASGQGLKLRISFRANLILGNYHFRSSAKKCGRASFRSSHSRE